MFTFYYRRVRPQCDFSILGRTEDGRDSWRATEIWSIAAWVRRGYSRFQITHPLCLKESSCLSGISCVGRRPVLNMKSGTNFLNVITIFLKTTNPRLTHTASTGNVQRKITQERETDMQIEVRRRDSSYTCKRGQEIWMVSRERKKTIKTSEEQEGDLGAHTEKACKTEAHTCAQQRWQVYAHERERERLMHTREREPQNAQGSWYVRGGGLITDEHATKQEATRALRRCDRNGLRGSLHGGG